MLLLTFASDGGKAPGGSPSLLIAVRVISPIPNVRQSEVGRRAKTSRSGQARAGILLASVYQAHLRALRLTAAELHLRQGLLL